MKKNVLWAAAGLLVCAGAAFAGITGDAIRIVANGDDTTGSWRLPTSSLNYDDSMDRWWWQSNGSIIVRDETGAPLVTFESLSISYIEDPVISLGFLAVAGGLNTNFTITSGVLGFTAGLYTANASAAITTTDTDGNGAVTTGGFGINDTYQALCDGVPIGTSTPGVAVGAFGSTTSMGSIGPANFFATSMQAKWNFDLSANDTASGTSVYVKTLVPAPGSAALLGLACLATGRRRRA